MRPTIRPATNTAMIANISMPYRPEPTPPKITSPSCISHIGTRPPSGVNESCIELTEPFDAAVVAVAQSAEFDDAEARFLAFHVAARLAMRVADVSTPAARAPDCRGCSAQTHTREQRDEHDRHRGEQRPALARVADHAAEGVAERAGISRIASISRKFDSGVGFSNGCAELTLKKPPPFVPSCLIAICDAAGPDGDRLLRLRSPSR